VVPGQLPLVPLFSSTFSLAFPFGATRIVAPYRNV
jgi:hypothetical protein